MFNSFLVRFESWAGRSAWNDRGVGIAEVAGSNPAPSTTREPRYFESRIFQVIWRLKNSGYSERTLKGYSKRLRMLAKHVNLDKPESVRSFIAGQEGWSNAYKEGIVNAYAHYAKEYSLSWDKPIYKRR